MNLMQNLQLNLPLLSSLQHVRKEIDKKIEEEVAVGRSERRKNLERDDEDIRRSLDGMRRWRRRK